MDRLSLSPAGPLHTGEGEVHLHGLPRFVAEDASTPASSRPVLTGPEKERADLLDAMSKRLGTELKGTASQLAKLLEDFITTKAGGASDPATIRAAIYQTTLPELLDLLDTAGLADAREKWWTDYRTLAGLAEESLANAGVDGADRSLDSEGAQAAIRAILDEQSASLWHAGIALPSATRILAGLRSSVSLQTLPEMAAVIARDEEITLPKAVTEARTRAAEYDRFVAGEAGSQADPEGDFLLWCYSGPGDGVTRPFCDRLLGKAFKRSQVARLDNHQPGTGHPAVSGGGFNCRHMWLQMPVGVAKASGYEIGTDSDIDAANAAAEAKR